MSADAQLRAECLRLIGMIRRLPMKAHLECDDTFYSCAVTEDYVGNDDRGMCTCGADSENLQLKRLNECADRLEERIVG